MSDVIAITTSNEFQFHGFQLQYDSTKLTKYQLFLQSILSLTIDQQKSVLLEDFIDEFSTVLTLCILFVKTFICYTYSDVSTGTNRKSTNVIADKIISENQKLLRNDIEVSAIVIPEEHSENNARNVPVENVLEPVDSNISTTTIDNNAVSNNAIINSSSSGSSSGSGTDSNNNNNNNYIDTNITATTSTNSTNSTNILITNACTDNDTYSLTASTVTAITTNIGSVSTDTCAGVSTGTGASVSTGTGASVSTGTGASLSTTTAVGCESGTDTGLSVSTDIGSKIFLSELIESSLSVAKIFCDVSFSNAGIGLQEKQQLGEGAREKIIQDKILAR